jgi:hypothetical protein
MREVTQRYRDPLDEIWIHAAEQLGFRIERTEDAYAHYDGKGTIFLCSEKHFDADDSLAQMILHELCHAIITGRDARHVEDWGLSNEDERDLVKEHACHRLQAGLAGRYGLREMLAVTTDHRSHWDTLPEDPMVLDPREAADPAIKLARAAWMDVRNTRWHEVICKALEATSAVARAAQSFAAERSLLKTARPFHATGFVQHRDATRTCASCAWCHIPKRGKALCRQAEAEPSAKQTHTKPESVACVYWEAELNDNACDPCGACCRTGFDLVPVRAKDAIRKHRPEWVVQSPVGLCLPRPNGLCVALTGDGSKPAPYRCTEYAHRPKACADFALGGEACLTARKRVGLAAWKP